MKQILNHLFLVLTFVISLSGNAQDVATTKIISSSNQWQFDKPQGYVYIHLNQNSSLEKSLVASHYSIYFNENKDYLPSFSTQLYLASFYHMDLFTNYEIGFLRKEGKISDTSSTTSYDYQSTELLALPISLGLNLNFAYGSWFQPFIKYALETMPYRLSSSLTSAEEQGSIESQKFGLGIKLNPFSSGLSLEGSLARRENFKNNKYYHNSEFYSLGMGWIF